MAASDDLSEEKNYFPVNTVAEICDRFAAAGLSCKTERHDDEERIVFENRQCYLAFTVNASGRPLTASMPDKTDYDAELGQIVFSVFNSIGWQFQP
jgi:hypothetical protein